MRLIVDGENVEPPANRKARALLAYLVRRPGRHAREKLAGLLWPEAPKEKARRSLRVALAKIRQILPEVLRADRNYVKLDHESLWVDVQELVALSEAGPADPSLRLERLKALWRGELLQALDGVAAGPIQEWLLLEREHVRQRALAQLHQLAGALEWKDDVEAARQAIHMILRLNPLEERAHRRLMRSLALSGDGAGALAQFERCRSLLAEKLEVEPMPVTTRLAARIRRLRQRPRHNLPHRPTPLLGRQQEMDELAQLLQNEPRMVTVFGPPGVGKTRFVIEAARKYQSTFLDGAALIQLAPLSEVNRLPSALARELDELGAIRPLRGTTDPHDHLLAELAELELLLVLDNYEHLLPEVGLVQEILERAPDVLLLVSSRARLNLRWERVLELGGLRVPGSEGVEGWREYGAVQLFEAAANRALPEFKITPAVRTKVSDVLHATEGFPLAIELVAAELRHRPLAELKVELGREAAIQSAPRDLPDRHRSLWSAIDSSWDLLDEAEKELFPRLAVFRGGFDAAAVEAVTGGARAQLTRLAEAALVQPADAGERRYRMHEMLRTYAQRRFEQRTEEAESVRLQHSGYFAEFTAREGAAMLMGQRQREARQAMLADWENVLQGWRTGMETRSSTILNGYVSGMWLVYEQMGWYQEGREFFEQAVQELESWRPGEFRDPLLEGRLRVRKGWFCFRTGMLAGAAQQMKRGEQLLEPVDEQGDDVGFARATRGLTWILRGDYQRAAELLDSTRELAQDSGSVFALAAMRTYQSMNALARGDLDIAESAVKESLRLAGELGDRRMIALAHVYRGNLCVLHGDREAATQAFDQGLNETRAFGDPWIEVLALRGLATLKLEVEEWPRAVEYFSRGLALSREIGEVRGVCMCLNGLGQAAYGVGHVREACAHFRQAFAQSSKGGLLPEALAALGGISVLEAVADEGKRAERRIRRILDDPGLAELDRRWLMQNVPVAVGSEPPPDQGRAMASVVARWPTLGGRVDARA